jgi:hypothetical protein
VDAVNGVDDDDDDDVTPSITGGAAVGVAISVGIGGPVVIGIVELEALSVVALASFAGLANNGNDPNDDDDDDDLFIICRCESKELCPVLIAVNT